MGLAALLAKKRLDAAPGDSQGTPQADKGKKSEGVELLSDDDSFYGEEEDELGVKSALRRKRLEQGPRPPKAKNTAQDDNGEAAKQALEVKQNE